MTVQPVNINIAEFSENDTRYQSWCCKKYYHVKRLIVVLAIVEITFGSILIAIGSIVWYEIPHSGIFLILAIFIGGFSLCCSILSIVSIFRVIPKLLLISIALRSFTVFADIGLFIVLIIRIVKPDTFLFVKKIYASVTESITPFSQFNITLVYVILPVLILHSLYGIWYVVKAVNGYVYVYEKRANTEENKLLSRLNFHHS